MGKWKRILPVVYMLLILPFFIGCIAAHPATDDFTFAERTHATFLATGSLPHVLKDAVSYAVRTWRDWQGTFTGVLVMTLNPAVFSWRLYGLHAVILLLLDQAACYLFLQHGLARQGIRREGTPWILALCLAQLLFLPDIVEGIYWFNGAWFYSGANAAALLMLIACDRLAEKKRPVLTALLCVGLFALGMDNYITAMMTGALLFFMMLGRVIPRGGKIDRTGAGTEALFLACLLIGLALSVLAPGNRVRMETDGAHQEGMGWLLSSVLWTMRDAVGYMLRFSIRTPLLALLCLMTPFLASQVRTQRGNIVVPWIMVYLVLCAMIIPHMYSSGYAGSGRVVNMYHDAVLMLFPLAWAGTVGRLPEPCRMHLRSQKGRWICGTLAAIALAVCLLGGQAGNYIKLIRDQVDGTQAAYRAQFQREYEICEAAGPEDDVVLPAWTVQTMTGKPTAYADPEVWTNVSMAAFFDVHSIRCEEE